MAFVIDGAYDTLFSGNDFYAQVQLTSTRNQIDNTFTVSVTGIAVWTLYSLNKKLTTSISLGTSSSNVVASASPSIPASGSNSYSGWLPKGGGYTSVSGCSYTFKANSNGVCPTVYLKFSVSTGNVKWLSKSEELGYTVYASATSSYSANISATAQSQAGGANDRTAPVFSSIDCYPSGSNSIYYTATVTAAGGYNLIVNNTTRGEKTPRNGHSSGSNVNGNITADSKVNNITITATKIVNGLTVSRSFSPDCTVPSFSSATLTPKSSNKSELKAKSNYKCRYALTSNTTKPSTWDGTANANSDFIKEYTVTNNSNNTRYVHIARDDYPTISNYKQLTSDNVLPNITLYTPEISGNDVTFSASSDVDVKNWSIRYRQKNTSTWTTILISTTTSKKITTTLGSDDAIQMNVEYEYQIYGTKSSNNLVGYSSTGEFKCLGTGRIFIDNTAVQATAFIYNNDRFKSGVPYIYDSLFDNGEYTDNRRHWRQTF